MSTKSSCSRYSTYSRCSNKCSKFWLVQLWTRLEPMFIVARGRIELPTPCFSDMG